MRVAKNLGFAAALLCYTVGSLAYIVLGTVLLLVVVVFDMVDQYGDTR
jgi:hypothetical protein